MGWIGIYYQPEKVKRCLNKKYIYYVLSIFIGSKDCRIEAVPDIDTYFFWYKLSFLHET